MKALIAWYLRAALLTIILMSTGVLAIEQDKVPGGLKVESIELRGSTTIDESEKDGLLDDYYHRELFPEDLVAIRNLITHYYIDHGYLSSGATISRDHYKNGVLYIDVVEGALPEMNISTSGNLTSRYINRLVSSKLNLPFNIQEFQVAIQRAEQDIRIDYIRAELRPGNSPGLSKMNLVVSETNPLHFVVKANNYRSPSVGEQQIQLGISHQNLTGHGDELSLFYDRTEGTDGGGIDYRFPVLSAATHAELYFLRGETIVIEKPFDEIDITSDIDTFGVMLNHVMWRESNQNIIAVGLERKSSKTTLLGEPYDFSFGYSDGESEASVLVLSGEYVRKTSQDALVARVIYRREVEWFGLNALPSPVDDFQLVIAQLKFARRFEWARLGQLVWSLTANLQLTKDILPSFEKFALGGHQSVRGYRENSLLKDNAFELLSEIRIPILQNVNLNGLEVSLIPFIGFARGWNSVDIANSNRFDELGSAGVGIKLTHGSGVGFDLFWAQRFNKKDRFGHSLQDQSLHMELRYVF